MNPNSASPPDHNPDNPNQLRVVTRSGPHQKTMSSKSDFSDKAAITLGLKESSIEFNNTTSSKVIMVISSNPNDQNVVKANVGISASASGGGLKGGVEREKAEVVKTMKAVAANSTGSHRTKSQCYITAGFEDKETGKIGVIWVNRPFAPGAEITFLDKHLDEVVEQMTMEDFKQIKFDL